MVHSGGNGGKKWRIHVYEKMGPCSLKIFDSKTIAGARFGRHSEDCTQGLRPVRCMDLLEDWLFEQPTFDYDKHSTYVNVKWFSVEGFSKGLHKLRLFFEQPIYKKEEKK